MNEDERQDVERLQREVARRQYVQRAPQPIAEPLSRLLSRQGYAQQVGMEQRDQAWRQAVGQTLAEHTRVGRLRRGVLEVIVRNSAVMQQLVFGKRQLLSRLAENAPGLTIRDCRFRVGAIE